MVQSYGADKVTGLLNRSSFDHDREQLMRRSAASKETGALIIFGLDNFRLINETYDHTVGDLALKKIGEKVSQILPENLNFYRLDGDMFALLWPGATEDDAAIIYASTRICLKTVQAEDERIFCTASSGAAFYPQDGSDAVNLRRHAEAALGMAKQRGRDRMVIFNEEAFKKMRHFIHMQAAFKESIEKGCENFLLYYQPMMDPSDGSVMGAETLLRWLDKDDGIISPAEFIPDLERSRLIVPVGRWTLKNAARTCKRWQQLNPDFKMGVNISLFQLEDYTFYDFVSETMREYGLKPGSIILELTSSQTVENWDYVNDQVRRFKRLGIHIAMDNFGSGYSSLMLLKSFDCEYVKIDRTFVKDIEESDYDKKLVKMTIDFCHDVNKKVVVEGVETKDACQFLKEECIADALQGYYFSRPIPEMNFEDYLRKNK